MIDEMKNQITVIITIRNREASRIENQVNSIRKYGANPTIHVVDYGSDEKYRKQYEEICSKLEIQYTHMYAEGLPWNKCQAINYGAKIASTPFIVTSDVDMLYTSNPFQWCLDNFEEKTIFTNKAIWLNKKNKIPRNYKYTLTPGGFVFQPRNVFFELNGLDEKIRYWGPEDVDWIQRLNSIGYKQIWIPDEYAMHHVWHPTLSSKYSKPFVAEYISNQLYFQNCYKAKVSQDFGNQITLEMRPILKYIQKESFESLTFDTGVFAKTDFILKLKSLSDKKGCYKINLQPRLKKRPLDNFRNIIPFILKPLVALTGNKIEFNENRNIDFLYMYLSVLISNGLKDYYIENDFSKIYLLW